jgi:hypothetical protein
MIHMPTNQCHVNEATGEGVEKLTRPAERERELRQEAAPVLVNIPVDGWPRGIEWVRE